MKHVKLRTFQYDWRKFWSRNNHFITVEKNWKCSARMLSIEENWIIQQEIIPAKNGIIISWLISRGKNRHMTSLRDVTIKIFQVNCWCQHFSDSEHIWYVFHRKEHPTVQKLWQYPILMTSSRYDVTVTSGGINFES